MSTGKEKDQSTDEPITIEAVEFKERGRPLLLGAELDATVQEYVCTILLVDQWSCQYHCGHGCSRRNYFCQEYVNAHFSWRTHCYYQKLGQVIVKQNGIREAKMFNIWKISPSQFEESRESS